MQIEMNICIYKAGIQSTIQDLGRYSYLSQGVPVAGAMDSLSARLANIAIGNREDLATIEFTYAVASFIAETDLLIAYGGEGALLMTGNLELPAYRPLFLPKGALVELQNNNNGARTYVAIAGGWDVPTILDSKSTYLTAGFGGYHGRTFMAKDQLKNNKNWTESTLKLFSKLKGTEPKFTKWGIFAKSFSPSEDNMIRVVPGREFSWFTSTSILYFVSSSYKIALNSNRMGLNLEGAAIERSKKEELLSTAVTPGTIQVTGNGNLVLLMADCQTTGGYPRIAQVAAVDIPRCAQLKPGDDITFKYISQENAEQLYIEQELDIKTLKIAINDKLQ